VSAIFSAELTYAGRELARVRADIAHADVIGLSAPLVERERSAAIRAYVYVWLAAILERVVRDSLRSLVSELSTAAVRHCDVRTSLFGLLCDAELQAIGDRSKQSGWPRRVALFSRLLDASPATFAGEVLPLDGRTLRGEHFDTMWLVFGFSGPSLPSPRHRASLKELADGRNEVAHGNSDPVLFGKTKATSDLVRLAERVDDVICHALSAMDEYLTRGHYRR
jgi:hypothetical protein